MRLISGSLAGAALFWAVVGPAAAGSPTATGQAPATASPPAAPKDAVNYIVWVHWKDAKGTTNHLQVLTTEGSFSLDTMQPGVKINNSEVPITLRFSGTLTVLSPEKGRLQLFLGRTVPYVTSTTFGASGTSSSSYQQLQVGLSSTFVVPFGKPLTVQADANEEVSILVKREES